ncbi:MAG TPA: HAMP domain-containing sensor histidine kinase [Verrucomicrobiae bacterium]|nr:HAMP domain-containing sensor histidine kinase [Verrucomicrobiae bacterium]
MKPEISCRFPDLFWRFWKTDSFLLSLTAFFFVSCPEEKSVWGASVPILGTNEITRFNQFGGLSGREASQGLPIRVKGVVLCSDPAWGQIYIHDGKEAKWFSPLSLTNQLDTGDSVEITGRTALVDGSAGLTNLSLTIHGRKALPPARRLEIGQFAQEFGQWVQMTGQVRVAETSWGRLALVVAAGGESCRVYVMGAPKGNDFKRFIGCTVRVRGINASKIERGRVTAAWLFAPGLDEVTILERSDLDPNHLPVVSIDSLLNRSLGSRTNRMIHVSGIVSAYKPGEYIDIKEPTGSIRGQIVQVNRIQVEERVHLWGFLAVQNNEPVLVDAYFEALHDPPRDVVSPLVEAPAVATNAAPELRQASAILSLTKDEASRHIPLRLRGVITYADPAWHNVFFHDDSGDVYAESAQPNVRAGQWVELTGQTSPGGFAPEVGNAVIQVLGETNLPAPARVELEDLASGNLDAHWVQLQGVVRRVSAEWSHLSLSIMTRQGRFRVVVPNFGAQPPPQNLVDALVRVDGACSSQVNARGQLSGVTLHVPSMEQIRIVEAVPADPFATRAVPIETVATFDPARLAGRRVKVSGVVTLILSGQGLIVQDSTGGIRASMTPRQDLHVGDAVEVLGFPAMGDFSPYLEEAIVQQAGRGTLPQPTKTTAEQILAQGTNDLRLVQVQAKLVQNISLSARQKLMLQDGPIIFSASVETSEPHQQLPPWPSGSVVRLNGVCSIQGNDHHDAESFRLLLGGAKDVVLVKAAPWWTLRHTILLAIGTGTAVLFGLVWIGLLRRQVRAQTALIQQNQKVLLETSRQAGMAEVATSVLHNVGNVLNSLNVTATLLDERVKNSRAPGLRRVVQLLEDHTADLGDFLTRDAKGQKVQAFLGQLADRLDSEQASIISDLASLRKNVEHIKEIVAMQQNYAKISGVVEKIALPDLVEDTLCMNAEAFARHDVRVVREFSPVAPINTDKHKVLQILVNLVRNSKYACDESNRSDKQIIVRISDSREHVRVSVIDNGVGIRSENLTRIFNHGFTTRKNGHGFGLHSGALAAKQLGGALTAHSDGPGHGATFTLELPKNLPPAPERADTES